MNISYYGDNKELKMKVHIYRHINANCVKVSVHITVFGVEIIQNYRAMLRRSIALPPGMGMRLITRLTRTANNQRI